MSKKLLNQFHCSRMMLPEHRQKLKEHQEKTAFKEKYPLPLLDEQQWEEFQHLLHQSIQIGVKLKITVLTSRGYSAITGVVTKVDAVSNQIVLTTARGTEKIAVKQLVDISFFSLP
jgi:hypothetical protein